MEGQGRDAGGAPLTAPSTVPPASATPGADSPEGGKTATSGAPSASTPAGSPAAVLIAAGDIACRPGARPAPETCQMAATADLAASRRPDVVTPLGDLQYERGELSAFQQSYDPTWGRMKPVTRPAPGNHEYGTRRAAGYFAYFGEAAGPPADGWYSYDVGAWHVVALNSNCVAVGGCDDDSRQVRWLRADLAAHPARCVLAYWHHPLFSSGLHGSDPRFEAFWRALADAGADVVLNGHDHHYERFAPLTPTGEVDAARGIRQFIVGTGGRSIYPVKRRLPASEAASDAGFGVLELRLRADGYDWEFVPAAGNQFTDSGSATCSA